MKRRCLLLALFLMAMTLTGCCLRHDWQDATCAAPKTCAKCGKTEGSTLSHKWEAATCETAKTCTACGKTDGDVLGHQWAAATCTTAKECGRCGKTEGDIPGHVWLDATATTPARCKNCAEMIPMDLPASGQVFLGADKQTRQTLTIHCNSTQSVYVKTKDFLKNDVFSFFVKAGDTVTVSVPMGNCYVYFAYGDEWYGPEYLFGPETTYGMDPELTNFTDYSWEYDLQPTTNGNFSQTVISGDAF